MSRRRGRLFLASILALFLLGTALGMYTGWRERPSSPAPVPPATEGPERVEPEKADVGEVILRFTTLYEGCGHEFREVRRERGLDLTRLNELFPGWTVKELGPGRLELSKVVQGVCPGEHTFLGLDGGYVAIFKGTPGEQPSLQERTRLHVSVLTPAEVDRLREGVIVSGPEEAWRYIEGLTQ